MATATERARAFKAAQKARGLAQFNVWVTRKQQPELKALFDMLAADPDLRIVSVAVQDGKTGRMKGVKIG